MFSEQSTFARFYRNGQRMTRQANRLGSWLFLAPGLSLILFGLAILVWPELLAYLVAGLLLAVGLSLTAWGWRLAFGNRRRRTVSWRSVDEQPTYSPWSENF